MKNRIVAIVMALMMLVASVAYADTVSGEFTGTAQGFGGDITALAVNIETAPTHIAGLPVAVNVGCHVTRHSETII